MVYLRNMFHWYSRLFRWGKNRVNPPYGHIVQIGDPILRRTCLDVPNDSFKSKEFKDLLSKMERVLNKYGCVGISAPQVGVGLKVFMMQLTEKQLYKYSDQEIKNMQISILPLTVFVNATMKTVNYEKVSLMEGCASVRGYFAEVPRFKEVVLKGFNANGDEISQNFSGYSARIAQHEYDHVQGKLYTDKMDCSTFHCQLWDQINQTNGKIKLVYET